MSLLDELVALGRSLPGEIKPVAADLADLVAGIVHALDQAGVLPADTSSPAAPAPASPAADERETIGSQVVDAAPSGADAPPEPAAADPLASYTVDELTAELAVRQQEAIAKADAEKSTVTTDPPPAP